MTKEEKQLVLKDLCARLPYGVKVHINSPIEEQNSMELFDVNLEGEHIGVGNEKWAFRAIPIIDYEDETKVIKPYLRPMSSMTEEEWEEFLDLIICVDKGKAIVEEDKIYEYNNFIYSYHLDNKNFIEKGLALEASKDMYKTKLS